MTFLSSSYSRIHPSGLSSFLWYIFLVCRPFELKKIQLTRYRPWRCRRTWAGLRGTGNEMRLVGWHRDAAVLPWWRHSEIRSRAPDQPSQMARYTPRSVETEGCPASPAGPLGGARGRRPSGLRCASWARLAASCTASARHQTPAWPPVPCWSCE